MLSALAGILRLVALREAMTQIRRPPHLRLGTAKQRCGLCVHWRSVDGPQGRCLLYGGFPTRASQVCDSFERR